jgi:Na+/H+ antiporter NhaD/arsenite permease-like protein
MSLIAVLIFAAVFILIATEKINRVAVVLFGAALVAALGIVSGHDIFFSESTGIDWNVIFLLLGMMIIVSIIKQTGVFEFLAIWAAKKSGGKPYRLLVMLLLITAIASPVLDNVTTILLVAPVTIMVCQRLEIPVAPYLIAEVLASNIGGASTLIGDPPNIIIASRAGLSFNDFLIHMTPAVVITFIVFTVLARWLFRRSFVYHPEKVQEVMALNEKAAIRDGRQLIRCLIVLGLVIVGFALHAVLDIEPSIVALLGAGVMILVSRTEPEEYLADVEWPTLVFFMGLFVIVGSLVKTGVIESLGTWAADAFGDNYFGAASALVFGSAILGAFFDNIPYTATMAPIVEGLVAQAPTQSAGEALWWAFALGADYGGNGTAVAASANVVVLGLAARNGQPISFWQFTKYGIVTTVVTTVLAWLYIWLRYFT